MSDTPRTDVAMRGLKLTGRPMTLDLQKIEKHAQQLERELTAMTAERDALLQWTSVNGVIELQRERDELRAEVDELKSQLYTTEHPFP